MPSKLVTVKDYEVMEKALSQVRPLPKGNANGPLARQLVNALDRMDYILIDKRTYSDMEIGANTHGFAT